MLGIKIQHAVCQMVDNIAQSVFFNCVYEALFVYEHGPACIVTG